MWICDNCQESNEDNFDTCWKCLTLSEDNFKTGGDIEDYDPNNTNYKIEIWKH